jgi:hypothetical protein
MRRLQALELRRGYDSMRQRKWFLPLLILGLYAVTWVGGWITHAHDLEASALDQYRWVQQRNAERAANSTDAEPPVLLELHKGGPSTGVNWCVPLLPGILLADSYSSIGPLGGNGGGKIVLYYGTGTVVLCNLWGWMS